MNKKVVFFLYNEFRLKLYLYLADKFRLKGFSVIFVVDKKKVYNQVNINDYIVLKYKRFNNVSVNSVSNRNYVESAILNTIDLDTNKFTLGQGVSVFVDTQSKLDDLNLSSCDYVFGGSGAHVQDIAIKNSAQNYGFRTCFTELSNIQGKTFFDANGANVSSRFYELDDDVLKGFDCEKYHDKFITWNENLKKEKLNPSFKPPQSNKANPFHLLVSALEDLIFNYASADTYKILSFSKHKYKSIISNYSHSSISCPESGGDDTHGFFIPLQVSTDTQLLYNSELDNIQLIEYFYDKARNKGVNLMVKIHPAEKSKEEISKIIDFCNVKKIKVSNRNTYELLMTSDFVGVNNSTVGLEAILLGKDVEFVGRTFYNRFSDKRWLYYYLFVYLIDLDFFDPHYEDDDLIDKIDFILSH